VLRLARRQFPDVALTHAQGMFEAVVPVTGSNECG
jgi:hypothetical protein